MLEEKISYLSQLQELLKAIGGLPEVEADIFARIKRVLDAIERELELTEKSWL